ncbi:MAG: cupredoxin domain-containing protein [Bacillota bacterium]|nr:cupredoxin domain-containing protein [Bacillota bacterium]
MKFFVVKKMTLIYILIAGLFLASITIWYILKVGDTVVFNQSTSQTMREIQMVTGEFKTTTKDGKEIESYRFDPGTIFMKKGENVRLLINGVNGEEHPFYIEGTTISGKVRKGAETAVPLQFNKKGTYRLICKTHPDKKHNGPMIAYIVVD